MCSSRDYHCDIATEALESTALGTWLLPENAQTPKLVVQKTFSRKGRPHRSSDTPLQPLPTQTNVKESTRQLQPAFRLSRGLKQTHLDLGQAGFHCHTCALCGMTYAPGEEADEKLHAAHHAKLVQGIRFHGWQNERVLHRDGLSGYVLLVLPTDPAPHLKKVREMAEVLEDQLGLVHGWLLSVPCKVYLYVSASKRVVGCVMLQTISSACPAIPAEDAAASTGDSSACEPLSRAPLSAVLQPTGRPVTAVLPAQTRESLQLRNGIFPSSGFAVSNTQECSGTAVAGRSVFSEPAGLQLQGTGQLQAFTPSGPSAGAARDDSLAPPQSQELCRTAPVKSRKRSWAPSGMLGSKRDSLGEPGTAERQSKAHLQRQQGILKGWLASGKKPSPKPEAEQSDCSMAAPPSPTASCCSGATRASAGLACAATTYREVLADRDLNQQSAGSQDRAALGGATSASHAPTQQQQADADMQSSGCRCSMSAADSQAEAKDDSMGREHKVHEQSSMLAQQQNNRQPYRALAPRPPDVSRGHGRAPLLVDESRRVAAVCGVRVVWVSVDARRQGIASKLLDLARCNFLAGYVVPRQELAFSQPTEHGRSFAASYTGSRKLLVYQ